jgi:hypothetical protein
VWAGGGLLLWSRAEEGAVGSLGGCGLVDWMELAEERECVAVGWQDALCAAVVCAVRSK